MNYYVLLYYYDADYLTRRAPLREEHLRRIRAAHARGDIVMAGPFGDPLDRGLLVFRTPDASVPDAFARQDPYVIHGVAVRWEIQPWTVVTEGM